MSAFGTTVRGVGFCWAHGALVIATVGSWGSGAAQEPAEEPLEAVLVETVVKLMLPETPWLSGENQIVALVEPSNTLWSPDRVRALVATNEFETLGLPEGVRRVTLEELDDGIAQLSPGALPGGLTLRRIEDAADVRGRDEDGRSRLVGARMRLRVLEAWASPDGTFVIHMEAHTNGPGQRSFKILYDVTVDRVERRWVVLDTQRLAIT